MKKSNPIYAIAIFTFAALGASLAQPLHADDAAPASAALGGSAPQTPTCTLDENGKPSCGCGY